MNDIRQIENVKLENILSEYLDKLVHHAFYRLGNIQDAEDVVQDIIVKLYTEKEKKNILNFTSYLFKTVSNACIDRLRRNINKKFSGIDSSIEAKRIAIPDHSEKMIQDAEFLRINKLLSEIPEEQSEVIRLRMIDELRFVEIADILEIPVTTVKSRFKYGVEKLKFYYENVKEVQNEMH